MRYKGKIYKRIMLLGNSGSGKSWTAQRLGEKQDIRLFIWIKNAGSPAGLILRRRNGRRKTGNT